MLELHVPLAMHRDGILQASHAPRRVEHLHVQIKPIEITKKAPHAEALLLSQRAVRPVRREVNGHPRPLYAPEAA